LPVLALCYAPLALFTDLDAGLADGEGVTQAEVFEVVPSNVKRCATWRHDHRRPPRRPRIRTSAPTP